MPKALSPRRLVFSVVTGGFLAALMAGLAWHTAGRSGYPPAMPWVCLLGALAPLAAAAAGWRRGHFSGRDGAPSAALGLALGAACAAAVLWP